MVGKAGVGKGSRMMRKISLLMAGAAMGASIAIVSSQSGLFSGAPANAAATDTYKMLNLFGDVYEKIRTDYVERPKEDKLIESAINGMLSGLDPHSSYMSPKSYQDMRVQTKGEFGGLGIEVTQQDGFVKVVAPIDDTPASRAGILANDLIVQIDGEQTKGLTLNQAVDKMRGKIGAPITLTVIRGPDKKKLDFRIVRDRIRIQAVRSRVEDGNIGYIRITQFNEQTYDGLKKAIAKLDKDIPADKLKGFIVDLRNNPGGLLDQSIAVSNAFLNKGEIVSTRGRNKDETQRYNARPGDLTKGKKVVILINGGSASASEIVAGALQDHKRATLIGTRSFGKGSVQTIIPLRMDRDNPAAIKLTTARYYTPAGRSVQEGGIEPDIRVPQLSDPDAERRQRYALRESDLRGHLVNEIGREDEALERDRIDDPRFTLTAAQLEEQGIEDFQLHYALETLRRTSRVTIAARAGSRTSRN